MNVSARLFGLLLLTSLLLPFAGCDRNTSIIIAPPGPVPAEPQRTGNPQTGYNTLINAPYVTCGMPLEAYLANAEALTPEQQINGRRGRNAQLPYYLTAYTSESGVELAVSNCLACHAGYFNGELIIGLGNESGDFTRDFVAAAETAGAYAETPEAAAEWQRWADRIGAIAPYMTTDTIGVNPANNLTLALIAHRDRDTLAWSEQPLLQPPPKDPLPVSVPPWWRMKKKNAMFYNAEGRGDHARMMMAIALLCTDSEAEARMIDEYAVDLRAYIASLQAPQYPFPIDHELAETGREVFNNTCARCHGTYGSDGSYPNLVIGLEEIGTDPALARQGTEQKDRFIRWFNESFYGKRARAEPAAGYIAPPLDGVWATAPYLHNGSVPSIAALLDSPRRPTYWTRSFDSTDYDPSTLGWHYQTLQQGKSAESDPERRKRIYDTTLPGYANSGHTFGDHLSETDRNAVLEYLKTL